MKNIKIIFLSLFVLTGFWSCNEEKWLTEEPLSFFAPENSYTTVPQFKKALNYLYGTLRTVHWEINGDERTSLHFGDIAYAGTDWPDAKFNNFNTWFVPTGGIANVFWETGYRCILNANTILNRLESSLATGDDKAAIEGEALFFRAFWFNMLANVYGDIPVYTEEITVARADFVRAPRSEAYQQASVDLERAITLLKDVNNVDDGRISKQAAQHLLTEVYINLGNYAKAIEVSSAVINHPQMGLMTTRFGSQASQPGDPYWDLFQVNNQNRKNSGNKESILVFQYEHNNSGSNRGYNFNRQGLPFYMNLRIIPVSGKVPLPSPAPTANFQPFRDFPQSMGGRGIGVIRPTDYFSVTVWGADGTKDYRNAPYMIVRDFQIENSTNPALHGEWFVADGHYDRLDPDGIPNRKLREFYPFVMKFARRDLMTDDVYVKNSDGSFRLSSYGDRLLVYTNMDNPSANSSMKDEYLFRLGGTYLLRAEAYIKNNNMAGALADINALRTRANATPATLSEINLDYLMDEQMRERYFEDYRMVTLMRMGKFVERAKKYHPLGSTVSDHHNLLPIPYSEIERNKDVKWNNNPGYN